MGSFVDVLEGILNHEARRRAALTPAQRRTEDRRNLANTILFWFVAGLFVASLVYVLAMGIETIVSTHFMSHYAAPIPQAPIQGRIFEPRSEGAPVQLFRPI